VYSSIGSSLIHKVNLMLVIGLNFINQVRMRCVGVVMCTPYLHFFSILWLSTMWLHCL